VHLWVTRVRNSGATDTSGSALNQKARSKSQLAFGVRSIMPRDCERASKLCEFSKVTVRSPTVRITIAQIGLAIGANGQEMHGTSPLDALRLGAPWLTAATRPIAKKRRTALFFVPAPPQVHSVPRES
jgi:hypothetical protein